MLKAKNFEDSVYFSDVTLKKTEAIPCLKRLARRIQLDIIFFSVSLMWFLYLGFFFFFEPDLIFL